jgi:murein DD-endopeptidase MepM/ murein hydrolase activator NlpD
MTRRHLHILLTAFAAVLVIGFAIPEEPMIPVTGATAKDWNPKSFWYEPWGASGVHKGIDVFAPQGRNVVSAIPGVVIFQGHLGIGGNVVAVLGPKWRVHYYAHLAPADPSPWFLSQGQKLGLVGTSGNAAGKPPHLHYSVVSIVPLPWRFSSDEQGWKKMFFLDPGALLQSGVPHVGQTDAPRLRAPLTLR